MQSAADILRKKLEGQEITTTTQRLALDEAENLIKNYCNRDFVPWQLNFTWANMAQDIIKARYTQTEAGAIPDHEVGSIHAGDMTISRSAELVAHRVNVDDLAKTYASELNNFRTFRWGR
ncbi:MAG: hypothetical protein MJZ10_11845 [Fibrobacter sp.]|nr:hypothetical protein [Fibrobacter sp.]